MSAPPFHLAFPVKDLAATRDFFVTALGCGLGRESDRWIDFDFHGHQITAHLAPEKAGDAAGREVDGDTVPVPHFGLILSWPDWEALAERLKRFGARFLIEPHVRFKGQVGEQATLFVADPSGNGLEFKAFRDTAAIFAR